MRISVIILGLLLFSGISGFSQSKKIDSLKLCIDHAKSDTLRARLLIVLGDELFAENPDTALSLFNSALSILSKDKTKYTDLLIAQAYQSKSRVYSFIYAISDTAIFLCEKSQKYFLKIKDSPDKYISYQAKMGLGICNYNFGSIHSDMGNNKLSLDYYAKALTMFTEISFTKGLIQTYNCIGLTYEDLAEHDKALEAYTKSMDLCNGKNTLTEKEKNRSLSNCYINIGSVYRNMGNFFKALEYYQKGLKTKETLGDKNGIGLCNMNIGLVFESQKNYAKAISYFTNAIGIYRQIENTSGIANCLINIGNVYLFMNQQDSALQKFNEALKVIEGTNDKQKFSALYLNIGLVYKDQGKLKLALDYYKKSLTLDRETGDRNGEAMVLLDIANLYISQRAFDQSIEYALQGLKIAEEIDALPVKCNVYMTLSAAYDSLNKAEKSLYYFKLYKESNDSLFNIEKTKAIAETESKYQSEKKQLLIDKMSKEKELQNSEMKKQRLIILFTVCGFVVVLIFSFVLFRLFIQKKKANKLLAEQKREIEYKNEALNQQNEEIRTQRDEIEAQRDEIMLQKEHIEEQKQEITDSINYAKRIQQAVLPSGEYARNIIGDHFILFKPKDIVSGDLYWATRINEWLIFTVADCTGHGVPGAFMSMLGVSFLNEIVRKKEITRASEVLNNLRQSVIEALQQRGESGEQKDGMDIALCAINMNSLEMQFSGANNPCWIVTSGQEAVCNQELIANSQQLDRVSELSGSELVEQIELKPDKQPIGIHSNMQPFTNQIYQLQKGDIIYLMSDGFEDQFGGPNRKKFLSKNLKNLLTANSQLPMAEQRQILETTIVDWIGSNEQIDDITVLGIKI